MVANKIVVKQNTSGEAIKEQLGISNDLPLIVLMGGATKLSSTDASFQNEQIKKGLAQAIIEIGANVIDGGTDSGVMGLLNTSLAELNFEGNYIGIAPNSKVYMPDENPPEGETYPLGHFHSHFVLVEGPDFGAELPVMYALIEALSVNQTSIGLLANGGYGAQMEVAENVRQGREVIVLSGSGRLADKLTLALRMPQLSHEIEINDLVTKGKFIPFNIDQPPEKLKELIRSKFI